MVGDATTPPESLVPRASGEVSPPPAAHAPDPDVGRGQHGSDRLAQVVDADCADELQGRIRTVLRAQIRRKPHVRPDCGKSAAVPAEDGHSPATGVQQPAVTDEHNDLLPAVGVGDIARPRRGRPEGEATLGSPLPAFENNGRRLPPEDERDAEADSIDARHTDELGLAREVGKGHGRDLGRHRNAHEGSKGRDDAMAATARSSTA